ncbi:Sorting nexin-24 [Branchiostoma belcheri]|nr:Sorting nexin-24 [Branchiostoma belcheri]
MVEPEDMSNVYHIYGFCHNANTEVVSLRNATCLAIFAIILSNDLDGTTSRYHHLIYIQIDHYEMSKPEIDWTASVIVLQTSGQDGGDLGRSGRGREMVGPLPYRVVFVIEVCAAGRRHTLEKRYSELHTLHRELKKTYLTPEFPPKRVRNWNPKVLEQRRRGLETYLQGLIHQDILPKILLDFLEINMATQLGYEEIDGISRDRNKASHQPVLSFSADSFLHPSQKGRWLDSCHPLPMFASSSSQKGDIPKCHATLVHWTLVLNGHPFSRTVQFGRESGLPRFSVL